MKYKAIGALACAVVLAVSSLNLPYLISADTGRYHQHLQAKKKAPCHHKDDVFCTHLPLLSINTGGREIPGKPVTVNHERVGFTTAKDGSDHIGARLAVFDSEEKNNHPTDAPTLTSDITVHIRGNTSRYFDKAGYRIKLVDEKGKNNPLPLLGMDAHHEWALHGPYLDKTLLRNYMWYNIAGEIMDYAPNVRFCELMINGEYMGVYVLTEVITAGKDGSRLNLTTDAKNNTFSGYLLLLDRIDGEESDHLKSFTTYTYNTKHKLEIKYPGASNMTDKIYEGIKRDFSAFEKALYSYDYDSDRLGYEKYVDVDSFVDYFLINEFTCNYDAGWLSTYIYKAADGKMRMCVWDFNSACDNYQQSMMAPNTFDMESCLWFIMLFKDEDFTERCIRRYKELRQSFLSEEYLNAYIDDVVAYLGPAVERNYEKWGYSFGEEQDLLRPEERNPRSYEEATANLRQFIHIRGNWLDENIETLRQYSAESKVKKFNENAN